MTRPLSVPLKDVDCTLGISRTRPLRRNSSSSSRDTICKSFLRNAVLLSPLIQYTYISCSEEATIPTNPRTSRPVGYAFVDLKKAEDAQKAIENLSGKDILERKVSVQLARNPEAQAPKTAAATGAAEGSADDGENNQRKRAAGRGRGGRSRGRGGRAVGGRTAKVGSENPETAADMLEPAAPLGDKTNTADQADATEATDAKLARPPRAPKQRGPPEDGIASTTKVMVANLPYDLTEEKVCSTHVVSLNP